MAKFREKFSKNLRGQAREGAARAGARRGGASRGAKARRGQARGAIKLVKDMVTAAYR